MDEVIAADINPENIYPFLDEKYEREFK